MKSRKNIIIVVAIAIVLVFVYYKTGFKIGRDEQAKETGNTNAVISREISATETYTAPDGEDTVKFTLSLDGKGVIVGARAENTADAGSEPMKKFSEKLSVVLTGKKLSELEAIDKVGTSSLTTAAFNKALDGLKAQI